MTHNGQGQGGALKGPVGPAAAREASLRADNASRPLGVLVITEHPIIRAGIASLLADHCDAVTVVTGPFEGPIDVVIYDVIGLHLSDGLDLGRAVLRHPERVLAMSRALQPGLTARALDLGAVAAIPISADAEQLLAFIRTAAEGHFHDGSTADLANQRQRDKLLGRDVGLSRRERQVLALIVAGARNREIALGLHLSPNTIKSIVKSAYRKVGVTTRAQATAWGVEHGFPTTRTLPT